MSGPYTVSQDQRDINVPDDPYALLDEEGHCIAILETSRMAEVLKAGLEGIQVNINTYGGVVQDWQCDINGVIEVVVADWDVNEEEDDHTYAQPFSGENPLHAWVYEPMGVVSYDPSVAMHRIMDVFRKGEESVYYLPKPRPPVDTEAKHAGTAWTVDDVQTKAQELGLDLTDEEAEAFLLNSASQIQSDMVERGWDSIETLLRMRDATPQ